MNNPYEIDTDIYSTRKRKYKDIEKLLQKKISHKKYKHNNDRFYNSSRKRMYDLQNTFYLFNQFKL